MKAAADTFRPNPKFSAYDVITQLGVGEALVSTLKDKGIPSVVERTLIRPPSSRDGTIYDTVVDRQAAFEVLSAKVETTVQTETVQQPASTQQPPADALEAGGGLGGLLSGIFGTNRPQSASDDDAADHAGSHPYGYGSCRRRCCRRTRSPSRWVGRRFGRAGHRSRGAGRHAALNPVGRIGCRAGRQALSSRPTYPP